MGPNRKLIFWIAGLVVGAVLLYFVGPPLLHLVVAIFWLVYSIVAGFIGWLVSVVLEALHLALSSIIQFVSIAISAVVFIALAAATVLLAQAAFRIILNQFTKIGEQMKAIGDSISKDAQRGAKDAFFVALLAVMLSGLLYATTEDFIDHFSTLRLLAASGIGFCVAKLFVMYPSRISKLAGLGLTLAVFAGTVVFVSYRYQLLPDVQAGLSRAIQVPLDDNERQRQLIKWVIVVLITIFSALAILYPFSWAEWKRMLKDGKKHPEEAEP